MKNTKFAAVAELILISCIFAAGLAFAGGPDIGGGGSFGTMANVNSPVPVANGGTAAETAADARTNLGLGTMAIEPKTNYVASDTFTGHTGDASDPHGTTLTQTTILSDSVDGVDVSAFVSASNASDTLNLRTNGSRAMTGSLKFSGNYALTLNTEDGSDTGFIGVGGGGAGGVNRGAMLYGYGNEAIGYGGWLGLYAGNINTGIIQFTTANTERMRVSYGGNLLIGTLTDDGVNALQVTGSVAMTGFAQLASPTAIPTAAAGRIYFNGTESKFKKCLNGTDWVDM